MIWAPTGPVLAVEILGIVPGMACQSCSQLDAAILHRSVRLGRCKEGKPAREAWDGVGLEPSCMVLEKRRCAPDMSNGWCGMGFQHIASQIAQWIPADITMNSIPLGFPAL